jgi:hypothetical protein
VLAAFSPSLAHADPFHIDLEAQAAKETRTAHAQMIADDVKPHPRAFLTVKVDTPITVKWKVANAHPTATVKDVVVHLVVVKTEKRDQPTVPRLNKNVAAESAVTIDFKPNEQTEGDMTFAIAHPGCYLLRLETRGAAGKGNHDFFAALDLVVVR